MSSEFDLAIIGSGSAAFATAIHARTKNLRVAMIERSQIGGTCVNVGCIPSKALLAAAEAAHIAGDLRFPGVEPSASAIDVAALVAGKDEIVTGLRKAKYQDLIAEYGWEVVTGSARFTEGPALEVDGRRVEADHYVIAAGAAPWIPPIDGLAGVDYLTSTTAMEIKELPRSMIVMGGSYVGLEMGQLFGRLGVHVTIIEALDRIAPNEEPEISEALGRILADEGITTVARAAVTKVEGTSFGVRVHAGGRAFDAERLLVATGRRPQTESLNLTAAGVEVGQRGEVVVDETLRTSNPRIWAVGDVTGHPQFVYVAGAHGSIAVDNAFGGAGRRVDYRTLPRVTFTSPNIASVGLTDAEVAARGVRCECRVLNLEHVPRAIVNRDTRGLVKIVAERDTGTVLGVHMLAANAGDCILAGVYALQNNMTVAQLAGTWAPYLTMSESIKLCAQTFTTDVAKLSCCAA